MCDHDLVLAIAGGEGTPPTHTRAAMLAERLAPQACMLFRASFVRRSKDSDSGTRERVQITVSGTAWYRVRAKHEK